MEKYGDMDTRNNLVKKSPRKIEPIQKEVKPDDRKKNSTVPKKK